LSGAPGRIVRLSAYRALAVVCALQGLMAAFSPAAVGGAAHLERKLPMHFTWYECEPNCGHWIGAVGTVTEETPKIFDEFAGGRDLGGATVVLDSAGGSVNDAIALGTKWRQIGLRTTVGSVTAMGGRLGVSPQAWCESMCVFLLLSGEIRYVPEQAHIGVHQIWLGNRVENAEVATYDAQDMMIVERDIGRLAKYTFDMGGTGELLSLSLEVPPWETLHELSPQELQTTNLINTAAVADVLPAARRADSAVSPAAPDSEQKRLVGTFKGRATPSATKSTKTAEAGLPNARIAPVSQDIK
jgi:hypothetical protein